MKVINRILNWIKEWWWVIIFLTLLQYFLDYCSKAI
jgi:hypothetical protein